MTSSGSEDSVPMYLMPIAAISGMFTLYYSLILVGRAMGYVRSKLSSSPPRFRTALKQNKERPSVVLQIVKLIVATLIYAYVVARVEEANFEVFDPYEILGLDSGAELAVVKKAYRALSLVHHPDKGGDSKVFNKIVLAYKALSDEESRENYERYGHPDGPQTSTLSFALPEWLIYPTGSTAITIVLMYVASFIALIWYVIQYLTKLDNAEVNAASGISVGKEDVDFLKKNLPKTTSPTDVLFYVTTTPVSLEISRKQIEQYNKLCADRKKQLAEEAEKQKRSSNKQMDIDDLLSGSGWADDNDNESTKKHEEEQKQRVALLKKASGKDPLKEVVLEDIDEGAIGWKWVEKTLAEEKVWPPKYDAMGSTGLGLTDSSVRRNLALLTGRLNSMILNNHPQLLHGAASRLLDTKYFGDSLIYRQRSVLLLELCIKIAVEIRNADLLKKIIEATTMFKIGCPVVDKEKCEWFQGVLKKSYGSDNAVPKLNILEKSIVTAGEEEVATDDLLTMSLKIDRPHAESVVQYKIAQCQKTGMDPRLALQGYREVWWIIVTSVQEGSKIADENFVGATPMIVINPAQKKCTFPMKFKAPSTPGKYSYKITIKALEYLGADQNFDIDVNVLDKMSIIDKDIEEEDDKKEK